MDKRIWVFFILFSFLIPSLVNAYSVTFVPENISQSYTINIHNLNNTFNQTYEVFGKAEIVNLTKGVYYITITSENYNPIHIELNLTEKGINKENKIKNTHIFLSISIPPNNRYPHKNKKNNKNN